ncbi:hypothetical protein KV205_27205 [Streptomyces sp. SKN60]|nr:hypothetical protein [Streptomyces sp. SKN60]
MLARSPPRRTGALPRRPRPGGPGRRDRAGEAGRPAGIRGPVSRRPGGARPPGGPRAADQGSLHHARGQRGRAARTDGGREPVPDSRHGRPAPRLDRPERTDQPRPQPSCRRLDADPDVGVRRIAAHRPDAPPEILEALLREHGEAFHTRQLIVDHPRFPRHRLRTLVDAPDAGARFVALRDPELPLDHLRRLAADPEAFVRAEAARHPRLPDTLLDVLLADQDPKVVEAAAAHPGLGWARMEGMLVDAEL